MIKQKIQQLKYRSLNNLKTIVNTFPLILKQKTNHHILEKKETKTTKKQEKQ